MSRNAWAADRLARLQATMDGYVDRGEATGLSWIVSRGGARFAGTAGSMVAGEDQPVTAESIFRVSSMTKPVTAVAALMLVEEDRLRLDEPVDRLLPELADRRVLAHPEGPLDQTVPAARPITVHDLLTFRMGLGMDFTFPPQPTLDALGELGIGAGPPAPQGPPPPDEWMRRLGTVPLERQPGERWLYHTSADVLGVLVARAADQSLDAVLGERIFEPLGMVDTGFAVAPEDLDRFGPCYGALTDTGERTIYDPTDGQWSKAPAFPGGGAGLVSTARDFATFGEMLRGGGRTGRTQLLSRVTVEAMATNQLEPGQGGPEPGGAMGWGLGVGVRRRRTGFASVGTYGWDGGLGSIWANDPAEDLTGVLLTNQMWTSPTAPAVCEAFWAATYAAIDD